MEASVAAGAAGAGGEGAAEAAEAQVAPGVDLSPVLERIEQVGGRVGELATQFQQFQQGPDDGLEEGADDALAALADLYGGLQQEQGAGIDAETASKLVDGLVEQRL